MKKIKKINGVVTLFNERQAAQCKLVAPTPIQRAQPTQENPNNITIDFIHHNCNEQCPFFKLSRSIDGAFDELTLLCVKDTLAPHYFFPLNKK